MINLRIISKSHAHIQTMTETSVQFQGDRHKTVGGDTNTRYIEDIYSFAVTTINIVIECNENISIFTIAKHE